MTTTSQSYTHLGIKVEPLPATVRTVAGGKVVDVRVDDERSILTYATVNVANVIDHQGRPYCY